ncbi:MAG: hypothetical protein ACON4U_19985 [Myxococcota bacterium]
MQRFGSKLHREVRLGPWKVYKFGHGLTLVPEKRTTTLGTGDNEDWTKSVSGLDLDFLLQLNIQTWFPKRQNYQRMAVSNSHSSIDMVAVDGRRAAHLFWLPEQGMSVPNVSTILRRPNRFDCTVQHIEDFCRQRLVRFWANRKEPIQPKTLIRLGEHISTRCHEQYCSQSKPNRVHLHVFAHDLETVLDDYSIVLQQLEQCGARISAWEWAIMLTKWGGRLALREYQLTRSLAINDLPDISLKSGAYKELSWDHEIEGLQSLLC